MKTKMPLPLPVQCIMPREKSSRKRKPFWILRVLTILQTKTIPPPRTILTWTCIVAKLVHHRATRASRITTALNILNDTTYTDAPTVATNT